MSIFGVFCTKSFPSSNNGPFLGAKNQNFLDKTKVIISHDKRFHGNDTAVDPNTPKGGSSYQPKANVPSCSPLLREGGDHDLSISLAGRSLSERVNCDIIAVFIVFGESKKCSIV